MPEKIGDGISLTLYLIRVECKWAREMYKGNSLGLLYI